VPSCAGRWAFNYFVEKMPDSTEGHGQASEIFRRDLAAPSEAHG
jgi:hypothetical protein